MVGNPTARIFGLAALAAALATALRPLTAGETPPSRLPDLVQERLSLGRAAERLKRAGKTTEAVATVRQMVAVARQAYRDAPLDLAASLESAANIFWADADFDAARAAQQEALNLREKHAGKDHWRTVDARYRLERIERLCKLDGDQRRRYREFLRLYEQARQRNYDSVTKYETYRKALTLQREILGDSDPEYLSYLFEVFRPAPYDSPRAHSIYRQLAKPPEEILALRRKALGEMHPDYALSLEAVAKDSATLRQALAIRKQTQGERHPRYAICLERLGRTLYFQEHRPEEGQACCARALAIFQDHIGPDYFPGGVLNALASMAWDQGQPDRAESYVQQRLKGMQTLADPRHYDNLRESNTFKTARGREQGRCWRSLGGISLRRGDYLQAAERFRESVDLYADGGAFLAASGSENEQWSHSKEAHEGFLGPYLVLALDRRAKIAPAQAYQRVLAVKGAWFMSQRLARAQRERPDLQPLYAELQTLAADLARDTLRPPPPGDRARWDRIDQQTGRKLALQWELGQRVLEQQRQQQGRPQLAQLQAALSGEAALVDFVHVGSVFPDAELSCCCNVRTGTFSKGLRYDSSVPDDNRLLAFVVRPAKEVVCVDLGPLQPLADAIDEWLRQARQGEVSPAAGGRLRDLLWQPLVPHLDGVRTVGVCPDGKLCLFPLAALPGSKPDTFLLEDLAVGIVPVPQLLTAAGTAPLGPADLLLLGDIDYAAEPGSALAELVPAARGAARKGPAVRFRPLPGTAWETKAIQDLFTATHPKAAVQILRGPAATKQALRQAAPRHRYLHLATHAFWRRVDNATGIALAGANRPAQAGRDDGILTAIEADQLDLRGTELVVLSACETALGRASAGEGLLGLQRAFQVAGARALVASLWKVDDAATAVLMEEFYTNLWQRKLPTLEALRQAQLTVLQEPQRVLRRRKELGDELAKAGKERDLDVGADRPLPAGSDRPRRSPPLWWAPFVLSGEGR
jgi:CHAT domain-containing protein